MRLNNMTEEAWEVKKKNIEEYVLTRKGTNTTFTYYIRVERDEKGELRRLIVEMSTEIIELPPIIFRIFGLLTKEGIVRKEELLGY